MPNYNKSARDAAMVARVGLRVDRATATTPQTTATAIFTIAGGRVLATLILGEVTTQLQGAANDMKLTANPTTGSSVDICAAVETNGLEAGGFLVVNGTAATALTKANAGSIIGQTVPVVLAIGTLDLDCAASRTGSIKWSLFYIPIDDGAYVEAA